ncbi:MAG: hypothetical protein ISS63_00285 [Desulfobacteraceae bacterium]|nr:hypothetical protein [Desulfobacteraceae bacterium]
MKALKKDLQSVVKSLKLLTKKTEQIAKALGKIETPRPAKKRPVAKSGKKTVTKKASKKTSAKKATSRTATDTVLSIIKRSRKGLNTSALEQKTTFDAIKVRNIIFRLKRQGKIQSKSRGIYVAI